MSDQEDQDDEMPPLIDPPPLPQLVRSDGPSSLDENENENENEKENEKENEYESDEEEEKKDEKKDEKKSIEGREVKINYVQNDNKDNDDDGDDEFYTSIEYKPLYFNQVTKHPPMDDCQRFPNCFLCAFRHCEFHDPDHFSELHPCPSCSYQYDPEDESEIKTFD